MVEPVTALTGVAGKLVPHAVKWVGAKAVDPVMMEYIRACATALEVSLTVKNVDATDASISLLAELLIATLERPEMLELIIFQPTRGTAPAIDDLGAIIVNRFVERGGDLDTSPVDVTDLVEAFLVYLPGYLKLAAARPGSPLLGYSLHGMLNEIRQAQERDVVAQAPDAWALKEAERRSANGDLRHRVFVNGGSIDEAFAVDGSAYNSLHALRVSFLTVASFDRIVVVGPTSFIDCTFLGGVSFANSHFLGPVSFRGSRFVDPVDFSGSRFASTVSLEDTVFERGAVFGRPGDANASTAFESLVVATRSAYGAHADYSGVRFGGPFDAERVMGTASASFAGAVFAQGGSLASSEFVAAIDLRQMRIHDGHLDLAALAADHIRADFHERETWDRVVGFDSVTLHGRLTAGDPLEAPGRDATEGRKPPADWRSLAYVESWDEGLLGVERDDTGHGGT